MNEKEVTNKDILDALTTLNDNTVANNDSIKELTEYLISKDEKEKEEQEIRAEKEATESKEQETVKAEESAKADSETQTYTELLTSIR